jgi:AcrR family transcriptional regulator
MADETRTRLLDAAGAAFAEAGFEGATVRDICARAGVNGAAVNYHFGDKERLYLEVIKYAHRYREEQAPFPAWHADTPPEVRLRDFIHTLIARLLVVQGLPWQTRLMMREFLQPTGACQAIAEEYVRPQFELLLDILSGLVPPGTPRHRLRQLAFSVVSQCLFYRIHQPVVEMLLDPEERRRHFTPARLADHITDVLLAALGRRPLFASSPSPPERAPRRVRVPRP